MAKLILILRGLVTFGVIMNIQGKEVNQNFTNQNLTTVPVVELFVNVTTLILSFNKINRLNANDFQDYPKITDLYLDNNNISYISPMAFYGLYNINNLYLYENAFEEFPDLRNITSLKNLQIQNNSIKILNSDYLELPELVVLHLGNNKLTEFNITFQLNQSKSITVAGNKLTKVPMLQTILPNLESLSFTSNDITGDLPCEYFAKIPKMKKLSIKHNTLNSLHICGGELLEQISLGNNNMTEAPILNNSLPNLRNFKFGSNPIKYLPTDYFNKTPNVVEIGMSSTGIDVLFNLSYVPNLRKLALDSNSLSTVTMDDFKDNKYLEELYLADNNLQEIPNMLEFAKFVESSSLTVSLGRNPLNCSGSDLCWLKTMLK